MKKCLVVSALLLAGCSMNHSIVPANGDRMPVVTVSAYTKAGCLERLRTESVTRGWNIREIEDSLDVGGLAAEIILFPVVKGISCSAYILAGDIPKDF